ncbi:MAG: fused MFS/spermidine synthase, partial [Armatimonadetes bacterium]|nr:fused MFS/spermidine synthase [Armatimonadota bacterium]
FWNCGEGGKGEAREDGGEIAKEAQVGQAREGTALSGPWLPFLAFFVGFVSLLYEIAWSRVLHIMLGSYVYATSAVLASFLLGLAIGSLVLARRVAAIADHAAFLGWAQLRIAFYALFSIVLATRLPGVYLFLYDISKQHFLFFQILQLTAVIAFTIIPTTLLGLSFPLICAMALKKGLPTGTTLGRLYGLNSAGTVLGSLLTGFVLIPQIGSQAALTLGVFGNGILGIILLAKQKTPARKLAWVGGVILLFWLLVPPWDQRALAVGPYAYAYMVAGEKLQKVTFVEELSRRVRKDPDQAGQKQTATAPQGRKRKSRGRGKEGKVTIGLASRSENFKVIYYKEGLTSNIAVTEDEKGVMIMTVNGKGDASNQFLDMSTQLLLGHLPLLHNPEARKVLVVGLGSGVTLGAIERYPVTDIHCVELEPAVFQGARLFDKYHHSALSDPRVRITYEDARTVLTRSRDQVDVIVSEPSNLWMGGVSNLFSQEHFLTCRKRLGPAGILCQWVHLYQIAPEDFRVILATVRSVFPHLSIWVHNNSDALILASLRPQQLSEPSRFPEAARELTALGLPNREILMAHRMATEIRMEKYLERARVHTDNNPILEFSAPRSLFADRSQEILDTLRRLSAIPLN